MDTESVGLVDISAHFLLQWGRGFESLKEIFDPQTFPKTIAVSIKINVVIVNGF